QALHIQSQLNQASAEREASQYALDQLHYEVLHNLVIETTRLGIDVKNLKMRVESLTSRLEFNERRARALESVVVYKPSDERIDTPPPAPEKVVTPFVSTSGTPPSQPIPAHTSGAGNTPPEGPGQRSRRRRRRRGRRSGGSAAAMMGGSLPQG